MAQEALLSLALASSRAERPSTSRRLTSLPSVAPTIGRAEETASTTSGSGLFQAEPGWMPASVAVPTAGHRLALGEDLGVGADADFQVLAPGALRDQHLLQLRGLRRSRASACAGRRRPGGDLGADRARRRAGRRARVPR